MAVTKLSPIILMGLLWEGACAFRLSKQSPKLKPQPPSTYLCKLFRNWLLSHIYLYLHSFVISICAIFTPRDESKTYPLQLFQKILLVRQAQFLVFVCVVSNIPRNAHLSNSASNCSLVSSNSEVTFSILLSSLHWRKVMHKPMMLRYKNDTLVTSVLSGSFWDWRKELFPSARMDAYMGWIIYTSLLCLNYIYLLRMWFLYTHIHDREEKCTS